MGYDACLGEFIGTEPYLMQAVQRNHPFLTRYTGSLATVRVYLLRTDAGVKLPFAVLKMAAPEQVADNYWRSGNLACDLDPVTGSIRNARTKNALGTTDHAAHPDTGARLVGETLPTWDRLVGLAHECSSIFAPVRYQSMDIAILEGRAVGNRSQFRRRVQHRPTRRRVADSLPTTFSSSSEPADTRVDARRKRHRAAPNGELPQLRH